MLKFKKIFSALFLALPVLFFCGCTSLIRISDEPFVVAESSAYIPDSIEWQKINEACEYFLFEDDRIPLRWHCTKIDLSNPHLRIDACPSEQGELKRGLTARAFAKKSESFVSVNTSPFSGRFLKTKTIVGTHKTDGKVISPANSAYSALAFKRENDGSLKAFILKEQNDEKIREYDWAFGGFFTILQNGELTYFSYESRNSRTAAGITADGKTLFLLVVEGERPYRSKGLSYPECAQIFLKLGATDAMQMDGGGSSSLFINGKNMLSYAPLRHNAAFFGFCME